MIEIRFELRSLDCIAADVWWCCVSRLIMWLRSGWTAINQNLIMFKVKIDYWRSWHHFVCTKQNYHLWQGFFVMIDTNLFSHPIFTSYGIINHILSMIVFPLLQCINLHLGFPTLGQIALDTSHLIIYRPNNLGSHAGNISHKHPFAFLRQTLLLAEIIFLFIPIWSLILAKWIHNAPKLIPWTSSQIITPDWPRPRINFINQSM